VVEAKRKPPEQIKKALHHEVVRESQRKSFAYPSAGTPVGVRSLLTASTGGLHFVTTTGYFLATSGLLVVLEP
jgi:hypothetical protein